MHYLTLTTTLERRQHNNPHFTDRETEVHRDEVFAQGHTVKWQGSNLNSDLPHDEDCAEMTYES